MHLLDNTALYFILVRCGRRLKQLVLLGSLAAHGLVAVLVLLGLPALTLFCRMLGAVIAFNQIINLVVALNGTREESWGLRTNHRVVEHVRSKF